LRCARKIASLHPITNYGDLQQTVVRCYGLYTTYLISDKITIVRELLISGALNAADYRIVKSQFERQITILEGKVMNAPSQERKLAPLLSQAAKNLSIIRERYQSADINEKRIMISSMYPEIYL
jgi:hypothetical protein